MKKDFLFIKELNKFSFKVATVGNLITAQKNPELILTLFYMNLEETKRVEKMKSDINCYFYCRKLVSVPTLQHQSSDFSFIEFDSRLCLQRERNTYCSKNFGCPCENSSTGILTAATDDITPIC